MFILRLSASTFAADASRFLPIRAVLENEFGVPASAWEIERGTPH